MMTPVATEGQTPFFLRNLWLFNMLPDFLIAREGAGLQFRVDQLSIDADFEAPAVGWNENEAFDFVFQIRDEFVGQTDRFRFVVSNLAVDDFYFHYLVPNNAFLI